MSTATVAPPAVTEYKPSNPKDAELLERLVARVGEEHRVDIVILYMAAFGSGCDKTFAEILRETVAVAR